MRNAAAFANSDNELQQGNLKTGEPVEMNDWSSHNSESCESRPSSSYQNGHSRGRGMPVHSAVGPVVKFNALIPLLAYPSVQDRTL
jgi:hypothetical protein